MFLAFLGAGACVFEIVPALMVASVALAFGLPLALLASVLPPRRPRQVSVDEHGIGRSQSPTAPPGEFTTWFRWHEVRKLSRGLNGVLFCDGSLVVRLEHRYFTRRFVLPSEVAEDPVFLEAARRAIPADRIAANAFDPEAARVRCRRVNVLLTLLVVLVMVAGAACSVSGGSLMAALVCAQLVAAVAINGLLCRGRTVASATMDGWWVIAPICLIGTWGVLSFTGEWAVLSGALWAVAGLGIGRFASASTGRDGRANWGHVALALVLAVGGYVGGRALFDGIPAVRVGPGEPTLFRAWTPDGNAFLLDERGIVGKPGPASLRWYAADGTPGTRVRLSKDLSMALPVRGGALLYTKEGDERELWLSHVEGGTPERLQTPCYPSRRSPNGAYAIGVVWQDDDTAEYVRVDATTGGEERVVLPASLENVRQVGVNDAGDLVVVTGKCSTDSRGHWYGRDNALPEDGRFPNPGELFAVRICRIDGTVLRTIYTADRPWLEADLSRDGRSLQACTTTDGTPPERAFIRIDLTAEPPATSATPQDGSRWYRRGSPDGRFVLEQRHVLRPGYAVDTRTGERHRLAVLPAFHMGESWSPDGTRVLVAQWPAPQHLWRYVLRRARGLPECQTLLIDLRGRFRELPGGAGSGRMGGNVAIAQDAKE